MDRNAEGAPEESHTRDGSSNGVAKEQLPGISQEMEDDRDSGRPPRMEIRIDKESDREEDEGSELSSRRSHDVPRNGFFSPQDGPIEELSTPDPALHGEEFVQRLETETQGNPSAGPSSSRLGMERSSSTNGAGSGMDLPEQPGTSSGGVAHEARASPTSPAIFIAETTLKKIGASKEARKRKGLGDLVQAALAAIGRKEPIHPETIFEPLRLAIETASIPLTTDSLDCISKLITYSFFSMPSTTLPTSDPSEKPQIPLIERAIDTICDCFQDEATPPEVQLQIVKSLLAAVLDDKIIVHGAGLLKAIRQVYNIFLLSRSVQNQHVAQGTLTQMVGTVFERVKIRLAQKEARLSMGRTASGRVTADGSQVDLNSSTTAAETGGNEHENEDDNDGEGDGSSEGASTLTSDLPANPEPREKMTLQSFENAKNFDDTRIGDNVPTMVTRAPTSSKSRRTASGQQTNGYEDRDFGEDDDEDEIYVKDAFLVFRSMCRLSTKILPQDQLQDLKSQNMRSKLISLSLVRVLMNNNIEVFTSPLVTIRGSVNNEPTSFGQAVNQYLRLSLSRNGASSVRQVFETSCEIFWLMLKEMRVMLKVRSIS